MLLSDSSVVILDEPTHGLDAVWMQKFRDIVDTMRRSDRAVLIASHKLDELERVADRVAILDHGRLSGVADSAAAEDSGAHYRLALMADNEEIHAGPGVRENRSSSCR